MPVLFYDNTIAKIVTANVNIIGAVNVALTNAAFNQANATISDITIAANTAGMALGSPVVTYASGNMVWSGNAVVFTATGAGYAANAVFYSDAGPKYLIGHYVLSNANTLALNDTFTLFCNQGIANIGDPNN